MELVKTVFFVKEFISHYSQMPINLQKMFIVYITTHVAMISIGYQMIISPIIFNYFLIPNIEKRLGRNLRYSILYQYFFLSRWLFPSAEVSFCIVRMFLKYKLFRISKLPPHENAYALQNAGYTIKDAKKIEIALSFFEVFNVLLTIISVLVAFVVSGKWNVFLSN